MNNPITRKEKLLKAIANGENPQISPITREEQYLSFIAGSGNSVPDNPITREEFYLDKIARQGTGGGGSGGEEPTPAEDTVNFYDYDGTLLYSYPVEEVMAMEELPALPTQKGLICQGWNWTLDDIKSHNRAVDVGANYITDDGKTRLYIKIENEIALAVKLNAQFLYSDGFIIDWGDGSEKTTGVFTHTYADVGEYVITVDVSGDSKMTFGYSNGYAFTTAPVSSSYTTLNMLLRRLELGKNVSFGTSGVGTNYALTSISIPNHITSNLYFSDCYSLKSVVIPNGVTSTALFFDNCYSLTSVTIPNGVTPTKLRFSSCYSLKSVVIPNSVTSIGSNAFQNCASLTSIVIPDGITSIRERAFYECSNLTNITIPNSVTSISNYMLASCSSLKSVTIPNSVTSIGEYAFNNCKLLESIVMPNSVTSIGKGAFYGNYVIKSVVMPNSVTSIGVNAFYNNYGLMHVKISNGVTIIPKSAFYSCKVLADVEMPDGVTSIEDQAFGSCSELLYIAMPSSLTSIGSSVFASCNKLKVCDFTKCTVVPTLASSNSFTSSTEIRVPAALYDEWIAATNWSSLASKIVAV